MDEARHPHDLDGYRGRGPACAVAALLPTTFWLIELEGSRLTETQFLHVFEDETQEWTPDRTRALRFRSAEAARAFAAEDWINGCMVAEHPAADLVNAATDFDDDDDEDLAVA